MLRFYGIHRPLALSWRKFLVLVANMPPGSVFYQRVHAETEEDEPITALMDRMMGREPAMSTMRLSPDDFAGRVS